MRAWPAIGVAVLLTACACCAPSPASMQRDLIEIRAAYVQAQRYEPTYCASHTKCDSVRTAGYNAAAALTIAEGDPSRASIKAAREDVLKYTTAELQP